MFSPNVYKDRLEAVQSVLRSQRVDMLLIAPGANLLYFTGIDAHLSTRLLLLVIPTEGRAKMIVPALEKLAVAPYAEHFDLLPWTDSDTSLPARKSVFAGASATPVIAVDNQLWSGHLLDLQTGLPSAKWIKGDTVVRKVRARKSSHEIDLLKRAAANADKALEELATQKFSGRTEKEIESEIQRLLLKYGDKSMSFCIVGSGPNSAIPHHNSGDRVIQPGDVIVLDFGGTFEGYQSDMTRMVKVKGGTTDTEFEKVYDIVNAANAAAHQAAREGVPAEHVDAAARKVIDDAGYGEYFVHRTGHGLGLDLHEDPYIIPGNSELLEIGNVFSIEPGIYLGGRFGVRIEDIAIITKDGEENINLSSHDLIYVD
jgi:Xaa-Pro aminopeptidase